MHLVVTSRAKYYKEVEPVASDEEDDDDGDDDDDDDDDDGDVCRAEDRRRRRPVVAEVVAVLLLVRRRDAARPGAVDEPVAEQLAPEKQKNQIVLNTDEQKGDGIAQR